MKLEIITKRKTIVRLKLRNEEKQNSNQSTIKYFTTLSENNEFFIRVAFEG